MAKPRPFRVELSRTAARELRRLSPGERERIKDALRREAARVADPTPGRGGKSVKRFAATTMDSSAWGSPLVSDVRHRPRTCPLRALGVLARRDLDHWLRGR